jgi:hypothetical protein
MEKMIAYCGINCAVCPEYLATKKDDDNMRKEVQNVWKNEYNVDLKLEDINCDGCKQNGRLSKYCQTCEIKKCAEGKNFENCAYCEDYACDDLNNLFAMLSSEFSGKNRLDGIRKGL